MLAAIMMGHFLARSVTVDGVAHRFQIWLPAAYNASQKWPAILFLHGSGERGDDGEKQTLVGLGPALRNGNVDVGAIVVFPQCPVSGHWIGPARRIAIAALDAAEQEFSIDRNRVALTGMSMGGAGVWVLAAEYPDRWSAIAPVCAWVRKPQQLPDVGDPAKWLISSSDPYAELARRLPNVPIWIFHGSDDPVVPVSNSRHMVGLLGANAAYTEFPHVGHNSWDPAYATTHVVTWLTEQRRRR